MLEIISASLPWIFYGLAALAVGGLIREGVRKWRGRRAARSATLPSNLREFQSRRATLSESDYNVDVYEIRRHINKVQAEERQRRGMAS